MNILDENILESQRQTLRGWRIRVRQIGEDAGRKGMKDDELIPWANAWAYFCAHRDEIDQQIRENEEA